MMGCEGNAGIRAKSVSKCPYCEGHTCEDVRGQEKGELVHARFIPCAALQGRNRAFMSISACIKDEVLKLDKLELGLEYKFVGVWRGDVLDIWHITRCYDATRSLVQSPYGHSIDLPPAIAGIYRQIRSEPWALVSILASQQCADVIPDTSLLHLKYGILLSLATQNMETPPVGVVAVGPETLLSQRLMEHASYLAERTIKATTESFEGTIKLDPTSNLIWAEAGEVSLSTGGVCLLGDWSKHKKKGLSRTVCLETGVVTLDTTLTSVPVSPLPLRACVWTYWDDVRAKQSEKVQLRTLIDVFGMPFLNTEQTKSAESQQVFEILASAVGTENPPQCQVPAAELKLFLRIATGLDVGFTPTATDLIKDYFVASRSERPQCLPHGAIETITSLAKAHARLSLRDTVVPSDVILVIYLYEVSMAKLFGASQMSAYKPVVREDLEPVDAYMTRQMECFKEWLDKYLMRFKLGD